MNMCTEIDFVINAMGITLYCPNRLNTPRFLPFDVRGRCKHCRSDGVEIDYVIEPKGVTISSTRMKHDKFVSFDNHFEFDDQSMLRLKMRGKQFTIPIKRVIEECKDTSIVLPTPMFRNVGDKNTPMFSKLKKNVVSNSTNRRVGDTHEEFAIETDKNTPMFRKNIMELPLVQNTLSVIDTAFDIAASNMDKEETNQNLALAKDQPHVLNALQMLDSGMSIAKELETENDAKEPIVLNSLNVLDAGIKMTAINDETKSNDEPKSTMLLDTLDIIDTAMNIAGIQDETFNKEKTLHTENNNDAALTEEEEAVIHLNM